jgi:hypothetical protein
MGGVEFQALAPIGAKDGAGPMALAGDRMRKFLAALLLCAGRVMSIDQLLCDAWGATTPSTRGAVRAGVFRLR